MAEVSQAAEASTQANDHTPVYELGFHVVPQAGEDGAAKAVEAIRKALGDAEIITEQFPQKMALAYQIERSAAGKREKYTESWFGFIKFAAERENIPALRAKLDAMREILRYLIIETVREDISAAPRRAVFVSDRLEGKTLEKPAAPKEASAEVSQEELDKSIDALVE